jgi:hypothetical protein
MGEREGGGDDAPVVMVSLLGLWAKIFLLLLSSEAAAMEGGRPAQGSFVPRLIGA